MPDSTYRDISAQGRRGVRCTFSNRRWPAFRQFLTVRSLTLKTDATSASVSALCSLNLRGINRLPFHTTEKLMETPHVDFQRRVHRAKFKLEIYLPTRASTTRRRAKTQISLVMSRRRLRY